MEHRAQIGGPQGIKRDMREYVDFFIIKKPNYDILFALQ